MSTEAEEMKKETDRQFVQQRFDELTTYMQGLYQEIDMAHANEHRSGNLTSLSLITWLIAVFAHILMRSGWSDLNETIGWLVYLLVVGRHWLTAIPAYICSRDELRGCVKTLGILGYLKEEHDGEARILKYKESLMAKLWDRMKQKIRQQAYATS